MHDDWITDAVAQATNLAEGTQLLDEATVRRQSRHSKSRTVELLPRLDGAALAEFTAQGFELDLSARGADELLAPMYLPEGWSRARTEHHMYDHLVDETGSPRVLVMYKGASYDRDAWMRFL